MPAGEKAAVPLLNPEDVPPYSVNESHALSSVAKTSTSPDLRRVLAWAASSPELARRKGALFLTRTTWELPRVYTNEIVATLELQAGPAESAPLVFAVTVE